MKRILYTFAALLLLNTSCAPVAKENKPGVIKVWIDEEGNKHREFKGDDGSYSHLVNGKLVELLSVVRK